MLYYFIYCVGDYWLEEKDEMEFFDWCCGNVVKIGYDIWFGYGFIILLGVMVGNGVVVGVGVVVSRDVVFYIIVGGVLVCFICECFDVVIGNCLD